jgi:acyl transferase domain-containing protein/NADPH:quinone reductase-like Zn-dependent oxidoreductase/thioesterase domain-containing protein/NADP-dependent 3-hydroxy acid dehydrogenase YdfG/acyl carrier protein
MNAKRAVQEGPIAIVGAGCRFPGGVTNLDTFDHLLREGVDAIQEIPSDRWSTLAFASPVPGVPGKTYSRWGGFLADIDRFEPEAFGISPREAALMDPQHRLLLEVVWDALEDASIPISSMAGSRTGVFVGISTFDYSHLQSALTSNQPVDPFIASGTSLSIAANRLSYCLDLRGPSFVVDTACSSSLVALDRAVKALQNGECDTAIVGGVNALLLPGVFVSFSAASMLSPDGRCKAFDASANGFVRAEGAGALVLRRAASAQALGDRVHASILGSAINQDGRTTGLAMPNGQAQAQLLRELYARLSIDPAAVAYVEAHGTGTAIGDPIEANAIGEVFSIGREASRPLTIGSVKTNIGHLEAGSGMAGALKTLLSLKHRTIYPNLHFRQPNPRIPFDELKLRIPVRTEAWPDHGGPAIAGVNSFGFGGTNAHVVLAENSAEVQTTRRHAAKRRTLAKSEAGPPRDVCGTKSFLLPITARSETALKELAAAFIQQLRGHESADLTPFCRTAALRRTHYENRLCAMGETGEELASRLQAFLDGESPAGVSVGTVRPGHRPLVFVFSGQGPQHPGMGRELLQREPVFRDTVGRCDELIGRHLGWSVLAEIERDSISSRIDQTFVAQPALFTIHAGLVALWQSWGITPSAVMGHSVGEVAAAWASGALELEDACRVIAFRSRTMQDARAGGKMLAAALTRQEAELRLRPFHGALSLAAVNGPKQVTLSGEAQAVDSVAAELETEGVWHRFLRVSHAFHSSAMDTAEVALRRGLNGLSSGEPRLPFISTVTGDQVRSGDLGADYWWRNVRQSVMFADAVRGVLQDSEPIFLEIGPHPVAASSLMECARAQHARIDVWPSLRRDAGAELTMRGTLAGLFTVGQSIDWDAVLPGEGEPVDLPPHPWHRERYWHEDPHAAALLRPRRFHPLLGFKQSAAVGTWERTLDAKTFPWLTDHRVKGTAVVPASAYVEHMLAALADMRGVEPGSTSEPLSAIFSLDNVQFQRALFLTGDSFPAVQATVSSEDHSVSIHSRIGSSHEAPWVRNAVADWSTAAVLRPERIELETVRERCREPVSPRWYYAQCHLVGLEYRPLFQSCRELWVGSGEALGRVEVEPSLGDLSSWWWHPTLLDGCLQVCSVSIPEEIRDVLRLPVRADRIRIWGRASGEVWAHAQLKHATQRAVVWDIRVCSKDGLVLAEILGFRAQRALGAPTQRAARSGLNVYTTRWELSPLSVEGLAPRDSGADDPEVRASAFAPLSSVNGTASHAMPEPGFETWIVFADARGVADAVIAQFTNRLARVIRVTRGEQFDGTAHQFQVNPDEPAHIGRVLESIGEDTGSVGIAHFWSLDVSEPARAAEQFDEDVRLSTLSALNLMKALAGQSRISVDRLVLVTQNAQKVSAEQEPCRANASGLLGLGRVAAHEFEGWLTKLIDLPESCGAAELDGIVDELLSRDAETESAWRNGQRFVPRLKAGPSADVHMLAPAEVSAFRLELASGGSFDALEWVPAERSRPGPGEIEMQVQYTAINFRDVLKCRDLYPAERAEEFALGDECSGVIIAVASGVTDFKVGDRVVGCVPGCFRSHVIANTGMLLPLLPDWDTSQAATIPIAFLTAWYSLRTVGRLEQGESVLIHAAAGGVGLAAVQIAQQCGARIFATAGSEEKRAMLRDLGCELVMDSRSLAFADQVREHTNGRGADVILNSLAGEALLQSVACLAPNGRFLEIGKRDLFDNSKLGLWPLRLNSSFHAIDLGAVLQQKPVLAGQLFSQLKAAFHNGSLRPLPHRIWPASQMADALRNMSQGKHTGKLLVDLRDPEVPIVSRDVPRVCFRQDATYVISGGLGGFGLETAKWIVKRGGKHIVLLSRRSPECSDAQAACAELGLLGAEPVAVLCDVGERRQVARVFEHLQATHPPVGGVFHAAAVIDDAALLNLNADRLHNVLRPKALGAWNLHEETRYLQLDHFVLFSSVSASVGNPGQGNYAAANAMLEALAAYRRSLGLPGTAIGWGLVQDAGFAAQRPELMKHAARHGFLGSTHAAYFDLLERLLARRSETAVVGDFDWRAFANSFFKARRPHGLMASIVAEFASGAGPQCLDTSSIREELEAAMPSQRGALLRNYLQSQVARILGLTAAKVDVERPIIELGLDSLMGIELAAVVEQNLAITLPALTLSHDLTVSRLAVDILERIGYTAERDRTDRPPAGSNGSSLPFQLIKPMRASGSKPQLICFHPIGGSVRRYEKLVEALEASIPVFGVQSRMLGGEDEFPSLPAMIAAYAGAIQDRFPAGPFWLFGYSLGGYLAVNVAQRLEAAGRLVEFVGVAECPDYKALASAGTHDRFARLIASAYQELANELPLKPLDDSDSFSIRRLAADLMQRPEEGPEILLAWLTDSGRAPKSVPKDSLRVYFQRLARHLLLAISSVERPVIRAPLFVWRAAHGISTETDIWRRVDNLPVSSVMIEADHSSVMSPPAVLEIAGQINAIYAMESVMA